ncbi:MAG: SagB/ThcOx family dehydrogenase [Enhydrobacter sp.]|nr:MAG: SagB/ThcOx family dehydrogenase [Enhydrobacter sp.]
MDYSRLFHHRSKEHGAGRRAHASPEAAAQAASTIHYKVYLRCEVVELPRPDIACSLSDAIRQRASRHADGAALSLDDIGGLLLWSGGIVGGKAPREGEARPSRRAHPSGGARYPIELYLLNLAGGELARGVYHYRVREHVLEAVFGGEVLDDAKDLFRYDWIARSSAVVVMTAIFDRTQDKYGERGYRYVLVEAGHIGQNLSLVGAARGIGVTMLGGTNDPAMEALLDLDGTTESVIYSAALSKASTR